VPEIWESPPSMLKHVDGGPPGGADGDPGALTINAEKTSMAGPLGGSDGDPGAPTINAGNVDGGPLGGDDGDPGVSTINARKHRW
jgi:hypothetical protein